MKLNERGVLAAAVGVTVIGTFTGVALSSLGFGIVATNPVPKADLNEAVNLNSDGVKLRTKHPTDVRIQTVTFEPGGRTGWHQRNGGCREALEMTANAM